nr:chloroplast J-like domain 1 [Tanacetum cinerariifolium]
MSQDLLTALDLVISFFFMGYTGIVNLIEFISGYVPVSLYNNQKVIVTAAISISLYLMASYLERWLQIYTCIVIGGPLTRAPNPTELKATYLQGDKTETGIKIFFYGQHAVFVVFSSLIVQVYFFK